MAERCIVIRGNHENMFCHDYKLPSSHWRYTWGKETLQSFSDGGVAPEDVANWIRKNTVLYFARGGHVVPGSLSKSAGIYAEAL